MLIQPRQLCQSVPDAPGLVFLRQPLQPSASKGELPCINVHLGEGLLALRKLQQQIQFGSPLQLSLGCHLKSIDEGNNRYLKPPP